jgi:acetyltransferase-like isoleucine patch superfamily enzyme
MSPRARPVRWWARAVQAGRRLRVRLRHPGVALGAGVVLGRGIVWDLHPAARVSVSDGARLGDGCRLHLGPARVRLGARCVLEDGVRLTIHECLTIGDGAWIGHEAVLIDVDQRTDDPESPVRRQGLATAPISIGPRAAVGHGAVVLRGRSVGAGARVGAHAVVTHDVPAGGAVEGIPARPGGAGTAAGAAT